MNGAPRGSVLKAAVMGGLVGGLLSAVPFVGALNVCCCALHVGAGAFAAWVLLTDSGGRAETGRCGIAGFLAGGLGSLVAVPLSGVLMRLVTSDAELARRLDVLRGVAHSMATPGVPGIPDSMLRGATGLELNAWTLLVTLLVAVVTSFFGLLGALAAAAILRRRAAGGSGGAEGSGTWSDGMPAVPPPWPEGAAPPGPPPLPPPMPSTHAGDRMSVEAPPDAGHPPAEHADSGPRAGEVPDDQLPELPVPDEPPTEPIP